jgi:hypothetical protein
MLLKRCAMTPSGVRNQVERTLDVFLYHDNGMREWFVTQLWSSHPVSERKRRDINANDNVTPFLLMSFCVIYISSYIVTNKSYIVTNKLGITLSISLHFHFFHQKCQCHECHLQSLCLPSSDEILTQMTMSHLFCLCHSVLFTYLHISLQISHISLQIS